jgi:Tol biopolymer transport system component
VSDVDGIDRRKEKNMRKLVALPLLAVALAALIAIPAAAKAPHANGRIAFVRFDPVLDDDFVYTANPDGSHEQQLLPTGAEGPRWSPDGTRIAVFPHDVEGVSQRIVNPGDGSYIDLLNPDPDLFLPCGVWSADGARLACEGFGNDPGDNGIYTIRSSDGGGLERVTANPGGDDCPGDYSPNGTRLVFLRMDDTGAALEIVKFDGTGLRRLTPAGMELTFACGSWSPQGNEILFSARSDPGARSSLFVVNTDGSGLRQIPIATCGDTAGCFQPVWSPNGQKIVFTRSVPGAHSDIYTVNADGRGLTPVTSTALGEDGPDWGTHQVIP